MSGDLPERAQLRCADSDRDVVIELLRRHGAAGRLDLDELRERINATLAAKTFGELDTLLADLPSEALPTPPVPWRYRRMVLVGGEIAIFDVFVLTIWLMAGRGTFWPGWLLVLSVFYFLRQAVREQLAKARRRELGQRRAA